MVANLPYVPAESLDSLPTDVREYEPRQALDGGPRGTALLARLVGQAASLDARALLAELDPRHAEDVRTLAHNHFAGQSVEVFNDLAGRQRLLRVAPR